MLTEVSGASKVVSNKKFNIQKTILRIPNLIEVQFYLQHSRPLHQFLIGPRMMDLHWSWESSPSPRGFTSKCFLQLVVLCFNILTLVDFQVQLGVWFLHNNNAATDTRFVFHNHQIHWKLILTSCVCCNFAIFQLWLLFTSIPPSNQKSSWFWLVSNYRLTSLKRTFFNELTHGW